MGEVIESKDAYNWSVSRIGQAFGLDRRTVAKRLQEHGVMPSGTRRGNPTYALSDVGPALFGEKTPIAGGLDLDQYPDARKAWYQSENERLKFEVAIKQLIPAHEFARELSTLAKTVAAGLDSLPDALERDAGLDPDAIERVQHVIDALREQMYQAATADMESPENG
jgi:phage terminase Nu1 subunit (DNA packaging protein)